jgi:putative ABC transport system permease protein
MLKYLPLVLAALARRKVRTVLTLLSVTVAFILFGLMIGFNATLEHLGDLAHPDRLLVQARYGAIQLPDSMKEQLAAIPGVTHVAVRAFIPGFYRDQKNFAFVVGFDQDAAIVIPEAKVSAAQYQALDQDLTAILLTRAYAKAFGKKVGDTFPFKAPQIPRADGGQTWNFHVIGIIDDMDSSPGGFALTSVKAINLGKADSARYKGNTFAVLISDPAQADAMASRIDQAFANSGAPTHTVTEKSIYQNAFASAGIDIGFVTEGVAGAGLFMILFLTGNGIAQSVRERISEFAVLKTIGFSDGGVMALVVAEAAIPCLIGAALGVGVAAWLAHIFPSLLPPGIGLPMPRITPPVMIYALTSAVVVAFLAAALPALRIARLDIATALSGRAG